MIIYGHRGAKGEAPENTLAGFRYAYGQGIRYFELDLVLSKDGIPVVIHDLTLDRTTGNTGRVADTPSSELATLDARMNTTPWPRPTGIPSLQDVMEACPDYTHLQLEVKSDNRQRLNILCNRLTELVQRQQLHERVAITSSDTWFLQEIKRRDRYIRTGFVADKRFPNSANLAARLKCDYLCLNWRICSPSLVESAHLRNLHVSTWTVNRIHDMIDLEKKGVDSIITDYPTSSRIYFDNRADNANLRLPSRLDKEHGEQSVPAS